MKQPEMTDRPSRSLVRRTRGIVAKRREGKASADERTPCPNCGRVTRTVGQGTCADCWQPKTVDGEPAIGRPVPRTEPLGLLHVLDDVPDIVWILALIAIAAGLARGVVVVLT
jgi:hypothetical protein